MVVHIMVWQMLQLSSAKIDMCSRQLQTCKKPVQLVYYACFYAGKFTLQLQSQRGCEQSLIVN